MKYISIVLSCVVLFCVGYFTYFYVFDKPVKTPVHVEQSVQEDIDIIDDTPHIRPADTMLEPGKIVNPNIVTDTVLTSIYEKAYYTYDVDGNIVHVKKQIEEIEYNAVYTEEILLLNGLSNKLEGFMKTDNNIEYKRILLFASDIRENTGQAFMASL